MKCSECQSWSSINMMHGECASFDASTGAEEHCSRFDSSPTQKMADAFRLRDSLGVSR